jgi:hypothetical protein
MPDDPQPASDAVVVVDPARLEEHHLFTVSPTLDESRTLKPAPVYISLGLEPSAFPEELGGFADESVSPFAQPKGVFDSALRAPGPSGSGMNLIWFFRGDSFYVYTEESEANGDEEEIRGPVLLADSTGSSFAGDWPEEFVAGVDAVVQGTAGFGGKLWFFQGSRYFRLKLSDGSVDIAPRPIADGWVGVPEPFASGIDAGLHGVGDFFGIVWLFRGSEYVRYDLEADVMELGPQPIAGNWGGETWPEEFAQGIDFAVYGTGDEAEKVYFVRGDKYIRYNLRTDRVEQGPRPLLRRWPLLSRFSPPPQLFLREKYALRTFRGEMGAGPLVEGTSPKVPAHGKTTFFIITRRSETISTATSSNILESQSDEAVKRFSRMTSDSRTEFSDKDSYDYDVATSFRGRAAVDLLGFSGTTSADQNTKGRAQSVRDGFTEATGGVVNELTNETRASHKQQVTTADEMHVVDVETETGFIQTIDNSQNPDNLNIELFQLTQEYVVVTALVDADLAFHNHDRQESRAVPIREMGSLLADCIVDPAARARIAATVQDVLANVVDHQGATRSLLVPLGPGSEEFRVDPNVRSEFEVLDSQGQVLRTIVVPGIVVHVDRPVVLTPNTEMALVHVP